MEVKLYNLGEIDNNQFDFAVICASYKDRWIFVRHKDRETWEIPGGHREENEDINVTASRELFEETGAINYEMEPICDYSVTIDGITTFGRLFYATVTRIGDLPESEICEVRFLKEIPNNLTYAEIQPQLYRKVLQHVNSNMLK